MRIRLAVLAVAVLAATLAVADRTSITITTDDHGSWAKFERNGVEYFTRDRAVVAEIQAALDRNRQSAKGHGEAELDRRFRALEAERRALEAKMRELEQRQRDLEAERRTLESSSRSNEGTANRAVEQIFERAVREGKAKKD